MFTTGSKFHCQNLLCRGAITPPICMCVCAFKCYHEVFTVSHFVVSLQTVSPPIHPLCLRGSFSLSPLSLIFSLSLFFLASVLITHTPQSGLSFRAFEVILAQILLSYTADITRKRLCLRASGNVCVYVCVSFCSLNHQCLLFHMCLHLSECVYKRNQQSKFLCVY